MKNDQKFCNFLLHFKILNNSSNIMEEFNIKLASISDAPIILEFIKKLAEYEKLSHEVTATLDDLKFYTFFRK